MKRLLRLTAVWILLSGAAFLPGCATLPAMTDIGFEDDEELAGEIVSRLATTD